MSNTDVTQTKPDVVFAKFMDAELLEVPEPARTLLESYSKIPSERVLPHVREVVCVADCTIPDK